MKLELDRERILPYLAFNNIPNPPLGVQINSLNNKPWFSPSGIAATEQECVMNDVVKGSTSGKKMSDITEDFAVSAARSWDSEMYSEGLPCRAEDSECWLRCFQIRLVCHAAAVASIPYLQDLQFPC